MLDLELANWNGTAISYDLNGNMLSDGTNALSWNARNQVQTLNSVSMQYGAFGRRIQNATGKSFLFDGANAVQELSGSTVLANVLSGGIDEILTHAGYIESSIASPHHSGLFAVESNKPVNLVCAYRRFSTEAQYGKTHNIHWDLFGASF
ncbi:MAG TPA: hypothetical protein VGK24_00320 [Candidatus Angelobacter sp.]|jgi:hypothetical protein